MIRRRRTRVDISRQKKEEENEMWKYSMVMISRGNRFTYGAYCVEIAEGIDPTS